MSNYNLNDNRADQNEQFDQAINDGEQGFIYTESKKPINRNLVVLLLIAVVGASMIYLMYLRGQFNSELQTAEQAQASEAVNSFMQSGGGSIDKLEQDLAKTEKQIALFKQDTSAGQVDASQLKLNPFTFGEAAPTKPVQQQTSQAQAVAVDPADPVRRAVAKTKIQMILYSANNSSVTINNWVYKPGDRIEIDAIPFTVKSIGAKSIVLSNPVGEFVVDAPGTQGM